MKTIFVSTPLSKSASRQSKPWYKSISLKKALWTVFLSVLTAAIAPLVASVFPSKDSPSVSGDFFQDSAKKKVNQPNQQNKVSGGSVQNADKVEGDQIGRDKVMGNKNINPKTEKVNGDKVQGDKVQGDKVMGDKVLGDKFEDHLHYYNHPPQRKLALDENFDQLVDTLRAHGDKVIRVSYFSGNTESQNVAEQLLDALWKKGFKNLKVSSVAASNHRRSNGLITYMPGPTLVELFVNPQ